MTESRSRRDFLRTAAGLAGAGEPVEAVFDESLPVPRAPQRAALADDEIIRMAVIGTGGMGMAHCDAVVIVGILANQAIVTGQPVDIPAFGQ